MPKIYGNREVGHGGKTYKPAKDGSIDVPAELVPTLLEQGFSKQPLEKGPEAASVPAAEARAMAERIADLEDLLAKVRRHAEEAVRAGDEQIVVLERQRDEAAQALAALQAEFEKADGERDVLASRVRELEAQLEQATAPETKKGKGK